MSHPVREQSDPAPSRSRPVVVVPGGPRGARTLPVWWLVLTDAALVVALGLLCLWPLGAAYTGNRWLVVAGVGLVLGVAIAWLSARFHLGPWSTALVTAASYLLVGSALVVPGRSNGVLPTADSLRDLVTGLVWAWRDCLTLPVPLGASGVVLIVPFVTALVGGLVAALLVWRSRWPGLAGVVLGVVLAVSAAFGDITADAALLRGLLVALVALVWLRWRAQRHVRSRWWPRVVATLAVVGVAGTVAIGAAALADQDAYRAVLRDHIDPPFDPRDYPSPLAKFRAYKKEPLRTETSLFTVDGIESGTLVRFAVMDTYDGIVWNVSGGSDSGADEGSGSGEESGQDSGTFRRLRNDPDANARATVRGQITINGYTGVWVPSVGETLAMTPVLDGRVDDEAASELVINRQTGTVAQIGGVVPGTTFEVEATVPTPLSDEEVVLLDADGSVSLPPPAIVPEELVDRVQRWRTEDAYSGGTGGSLALFLRDAFREHGFYTDGIDDDVPAGHGASRLAELTATATPVGNAEQYAAAMGVIGQRLGLPIRVVVGFRVPAGGGEVRGEDVTAWTEVKIEGAGWVPFDPTPPEDQELRRPNDDPDEEPQPQVLQPPRVPGEPKEATDNLQQGDGQRRQIDVLAVLGTILGVALDIALVALLLSPLWGILLYKFLRRRRRRRADDPAVRLGGAWRELSDRARDLGVAAPPGATRRERAYTVAERYDAVSVVTLAHTADRFVYGGTAPSEEEARDYWADVDSALARIRKATPWWRRVLARFSLASVPWRRGLTRLRAATARGLRRTGRRVRRLLLALPPVAWLARRARSLLSRRRP